MVLQSRKVFGCCIRGIFSCNTCLGHRWGFKSLGPKFSDSFSFVFDWQNIAGFITETITNKY